MFSMFYLYFNLSVHRMTFLPLSIHESCFFIRHMSRSSLMNFKSIHSLMSSRSIKDSAELQNIFPHTRLHLNDNNFLISDTYSSIFNESKKKFRCDNSAETKYSRLAPIRCPGGLAFGS